MPRLRRADKKVGGRLLLSAEARDVIEREASRYRDVETGGILIGRIESATEIHVTHASGPGPNAVHQPAHFLRDTTYCAGVLREHYERHGVDYVGEWHSHVNLLRVPSHGDLLTLAGIMSDPDYDFQVFSMLLAVKGRGRWRRGLELHGFLATRQAARTVSIEKAEILKA
ncbi:MAG: Mov34/MPN/PAD-1 family protein [Acidobacteria bacterium]|nr:Mov34/MPN/PAD-1 family protein [Acidobacteriota bacterium]